MLYVAGDSIGLWNVGKVSKEVIATFPGYTFLMMLQPEGEGLVPGTLLPGEKGLFATEGVVKAEVFAGALEGGVRYEAQPQDAESPGYFSATTTSGKLEIVPAGDGGDLQMSLRQKPGHLILAAKNISN
jgi:hypothetical protein